jgi:hypothetical protein
VTEEGEGASWLWLWKEKTTSLREKWEERHVGALIDQRNKGVSGPFVVSAWVRESRIQGK